MHDEGKCGSLEALMYADRVGRIESVLTMVGGRVVFSADRFKKWEQ